MNKRLKIVMTTVSAGLVGCAPATVPVDPELICRDRRVTVNHAAGYLTAYPEHIEMCAGQDLAIELVPPVEVGAARTAPARENKGRAPWFVASNREADEILVRIPEDAEYATYKYSISIDGVGTLDPRVTVARR
jgi:hypothetical protein